MLLNAVIQIRMGRTEFRTQYARGRPLYLIGKARTLKATFSGLFAGDSAGE